MVQRYLESIPLTSQNDAMVLASASGWEILEALREAGTDGLMVNEISERLELPKSTVYGALRQLRAAKLVKVKRYKKKIGTPSKERSNDEHRTNKKKQIFLADIGWGLMEYNSDFAIFLAKRANDIIKNSRIAEQCTGVVGEILTKMKIDSDGKEMLPGKKICPNCELDHEARELVWALLVAMMEHAWNSEEMEKKCKSIGFTV